MRYVAIKGMEIPEGCEYCELRYRHQGAYCTDHCFPIMGNIDPWTFGRVKNGDKPDWCPLTIVEGIEVKEETT